MQSNGYELMVFIAPFMETVEGGEMSKSKVKFIGKKKDQPKDCLFCSQISIQEATKADWVRMSARYVGIRCCTRKSCMNYAARLVLNFLKDHEIVAMVEA